MIRVLLAITGLLLILFLIVHLAGLSLAVAAPLTFESYASALHRSSWINLIEFALLAVALLHIALTLYKTVKNYQAGSSYALSSRRTDYLAVLAARCQSIGGIYLLSFLFIHLDQFRFPRPELGMELSTLQFVLNSPLNLLVYSLSSLALFLHLYHGIESSQRSLGRLTIDNVLLIRVFGRSLSLLITLGFTLIVILLRWPFSLY